ncbi:MAG: hypothetical protein NTX28_05165 [Novosphingobium sp.]|nr:hypothetical protein [Novosphingobium sp.]
MMRRLCLVALALSMASCAKEPATGRTADSETARDAAAPASEAAAMALDPAITGLWQPYDNASNARLGTMDVQRDRIVFGKGLTLRFAPATTTLARIAPADGARPVSGADTLCGADPVLSVSFSVKETAPKKVLRVSVHDVATGPGPDPDFDLHRCQTFTYVRD